MTNRPLLPSGIAATVSVLACLTGTPVLRAQAVPVTPAPAQAPCPSCAEWNAPQRPFRIHGNSYFVGTHGLSAILVTGSAGHVLIDAGLPESAAPILASIRALGFKPEDVRIILNSHAHFDHAGGIADLQRATKASVAASPASRAVIMRGASGPDDPQYGLPSTMKPVRNVRALADGEVVRVGSVSVVAHFTGGHTPGGTSWSWQSCEGARCLELVYADSQTPVSADGFKYSTSTTYPNGVKDFERGHALLESMRCDILITPHPSASQLWERVARRDSGNVRALEDADACKRYAANARKALAARLERERK